MPAARKTPRKWRDLGESFSGYIFLFANSDSKSKSFAPQLSHKSDKSRIFYGFSLEIQAKSHHLSQGSPTVSRKRLWSRPVGHSDRLSRSFSHGSDRSQIIFWERGHRSRPVYARRSAGTRSVAAPEGVAVCGTGHCLWRLL